MARKPTGDEFSKPVKEALAKRAHYYCSRPSCRKPTIGASHETPMATKSIGEAAHIRGAHPGSARHDATMTPEQRRDIENGIWLCSDHAKEVDSDVAEFTVDLLHEWRAEHQRWVGDRFGKSQAARTAGSHTQVMIGSPGGVQVAGDVQVSSERLIIHSMGMSIELLQTTVPRAVSPPTVDFGLGKVVALFTKSKLRFRFESDMRVTDEQFERETRRLVFDFKPESPNELMGKPIGFVSQFEILAMNFADVLKIQNFAQNGERVALRLVLQINGIGVGSQLGWIDPSTALARGQIDLNVRSMFQEAPGAYSRAIAMALG